MTTSVWHVLWISVLSGWSLGEEDSGMNSVLPGAALSNGCLTNNVTIATETCDTQLTVTIRKVSRNHDVTVEDALNSTCSVRLRRPIVSLDDMPDTSHALWIHVDFVSSAWRRTQACYTALIDACSRGGGHDADRMFVQLHRAQRRTRPYGEACVTPESQDRQTMLWCYLPLLGRAQKCIRAFDEKYSLSVENSNYTHACRLVGTLLQCYNEVQAHVTAKCSQSGGSAFRDNKMAPLVEETREFVRARCRLPPQYTRLYHNSAKKTNPNSWKSPLLMLVILICIFE